MKRNIPLLEATMTHILDHPDRHNQRRWISTVADEILRHERAKGVRQTKTATGCGTVACFAGWSLLLDGMTTWEVFQLERVMPLAAERLGLTKSEALKMFDADNTREQLAQMVKDLVNGEDIMDMVYRDDGTVVPNLVNGDDSLDVALAQ